MVLWVSTLFSPTKIRFNYLRFGNPLLHIKITAHNQPIHFFRTKDLLIHYFCYIDTKIDGLLCITECVKGKN